jgi:signal transduction histidine kinase
MRRLYFRIYLAVLGSLLVFAMLAALTFATIRSIDDEDRRSWAGMGVDIAERILPPERSPASVETELTSWHQLTGFSLALLSPRGDVIAQAGDIPEEILHDLRRRRGFGPPWRAGGRIHGLRFNDGRRLVALRPPGALTGLRHLRWLAALFGIAFAVGIAAYPVVRYLTRRLERLQRGVAAFGAGDLSARVDISGQDEIAKLAETFNASAARIEQLLNAHKTLLANASHELRSPLSRLRMAVEGLGKSDEASAARAEIRRNIAELDALVEEVLLASRLQAGVDPDMRRESVDLVGLLAEECAPYGADLQAPAGGMPLLSGDARLLRRLFRNLLDNAARYGGSEPPTVTVRRAGDAIDVAVCDRGPGVPQDEREKIFEPFYRLRNMPESAGGAGLGLALVRQIAERHGGSVICGARDGGGTCFRVALPLAALGSPPRE